MAIANTYANRLIGLQMFKEATWGVKGQANAKLMGIIPTWTFTPHYKSILLDEQRNSLTPAWNKYIGVLGGEFTGGIHATYEELPRWMLGALQGGVSPTPPPITAAIQSSTMSAANHAWNSVAYSPALELFVAVSEDSLALGNSHVMTSVDGVTWVVVAGMTPTNRVWTSVCWSSDLALFVAVASDGTGNRVMTSPDGLAWTSQTSAGDYGWKSVCWSSDLTLFVAVATGAAGTGQHVMTSPDGLAWTLRNNAVGDDWYSVCWSADLTLFIAVGAFGAISSSVNGIDWLPQPGPTTTSALTSVCWSSTLTLFVAVSDDHDGIIVTSPNGTVWTNQTTPAGGLTSVCYADGIGFVAVGDSTISNDGNPVVFSADGITWVYVGSPSLGGYSYWSAVCFGDSPASLFVAVSYTGVNLQVMTSPDGMIWKFQPDDLPIEITTVAPHGFSTGFGVIVSGHALNTNANGTWTITVTGPSVFTLDGSIGNDFGAATGTVVTTGPFTYQFAGPGSAVWNPLSYTFEHGYDITSIVAAGALLQKLSIKGEISKNWELSASGFYKQHYQHDPATIVSSTNASPIEITTTANHGLIDGDGVVVTGHLTNTAANGQWTILRTAANKFTLTGSVGTGAGTGGTFEQTITPALPNRVVEAVLMPGTVLYADPAGSTVGTTLVDSRMQSFGVEIDTGLKPVYAGGSAAPTSFVYEVYKVTTSFKLLQNAQVKALLASLFAGNAMLFEIKATGSGGRQVTIDLSCALTDNPKEYTNSDGAICVELKMEAIYDAGTFANFFKMAVITPTALEP